MDLRQMRQFVAVAEEGHFGRAARRLKMAQPPLSQAIMRLERDLGVVLFDRSHRSPELTEAGRIFLMGSRKTLIQAQLARTMAQRAAAKRTEIRIGFIGPALYRFLPEFLIAYRAGAPDLETRLIEYTSDTQIEAILSGDLDVGLVSTLTDRHVGIESTVVERASRRAAVPANWEIAKQKSIKVVDLAKLPFILPPQKYAPHYSETLSMFEHLGAMPTVVQEATQLNTMLSLVGVGLGCCIVMSHAEYAHPKNVAFLKIEDAPQYRPWELSMIWASEQTSDLSRKFVKTVRAYLAATPQLLDLADDA